MQSTITETIFSPDSTENRCIAYIDMLCSIYRYAKKFLDEKSSLLYIYVQMLIFYVRFIWYIDMLKRFAKKDIGVGTSGVRDSHAAQSWRIRRPAS